MFNEILQKCCFQLPDQWTWNQYGTDQPSLAMMAEIEEQEIRKQSMVPDDEHNLRLWMMVFSPVQQALWLDVGLYTTTVIWRNDGDLELFGQLELAWVVNNNEEKGTVIHLGHPAGILGQLVSDRTNNWSPIFFIGLKKGENKDWCVPLDIKIREQ